MRSILILIIKLKIVLYLVVLSTCIIDSVNCKAVDVKVIKVKRKTDSYSEVTVNKIGNFSKDVKGRGFLPHGGLFSIGKVLNFFPVGGEKECQPDHGYAAARAGICLNPYDCRQRDGKAAGDCALGFGVCCIFEVTCGAVVQNNISFFMSPGFPDLWTGDNDCEIKIEKLHAGITQLRIDFVHFNLGQPNRSTGECDEDVMMLGSEGNMFKLCGQNHGQHLYYNMPSTAEAREDDELAGASQTRLLMRLRGPLIPRMWLIRVAQLPLAYAAPHNCLQYFTQSDGTLTTFNYAVNGRHLAGQNYRACIRRNEDRCGVRYSPCGRTTFRIGYGDNPQAPANIIDPQTDILEDIRPGIGLGPGTGFYGPDGSFGPANIATTAAPTAALVSDQQTLDTENDAVMEEGMMPANGDQSQQDMIEGSGDDPQIGQNTSQNTQPQPQSSVMSTIWSYIWPSWLWGSQRRGARTWKRWSPYAQHYFTREEPENFKYYGYGKFGDGLLGFGRLRCNDRITIPCDNEYFISNSAYGPGVCDPHHCGNNFCPGLPFQNCQVETSVSPFAVTINFGPPSFKSNAEDNIGACIKYMQMPCNS